jgi:hypothetical protein
VEGGFVDARLITLHKTTEPQNHKTTFPQDLNSNK